MNAKGIPILFFVLLLTLFTPALAANAQFVYTTNADSTLTITGYSGTNTEVAIPCEINGLTVAAVGEFAFYESFGLSAITIPSSIESIGDSAFQECPRLTNVIFADGITNIGSSAFNDCSGLISITIPATVSSVGQYAFNYCGSLVQISVSASSVFYASSNGVLFDKSQSTLIQYPVGLIGDYTVPASVTNIMPFAFSGASGLMSVTIPGSVSYLSDYSFRDCYGLTNAIMENGVASIGEQSFFDCFALANVSVPTCVTNIGSSAFEDRSSLGAMTIPGGVSTIATGAFYACSCLTNLELLEGLSNIESSAFYDCSSLANVSIPGTVTSISDFAFFGCDSLSEVYFTGNAPLLGRSVFQGNYDDYPTLYYFPGTTGWTEFATATGASIVFWNPVIQTGDGNFGIQGNQFGFNISGTSNIPIVVEACANLAKPCWLPVRSLMLTNGLAYFSEELHSDSSARFYRISPP